MIPKINSILFATDLSKNSTYAFSHAVDMAKRHDAKIVVLHAFEPIPAWAEGLARITDEMKVKQQEEIIEGIKKRLREFCKKTESQLGPPGVELVSKILVTRGYPPEEILNATDEERCDVIVLGTHGKGFLAYTFLGSVSNAVLHRTRNPVFVIPLPSEKTASEGDMIPQVKKILYATDLSKNSVYAFLYAVDMAKRHNARIVILHTVEPVPESIYVEEGAMGMEAVLEKAKKQEQNADTEEITKRLQEFCKRAEKQTGPPCIELVSKILVPVGHPVEEILKTAGAESCGAIVLGTHGKGFLKQTFLGSIAEDVLQRTPKPVFIIPLPSEKADIDWDKMF